MIIAIQTNSLLLAVIVGVLFTTGTFMMLRRGQIRLILGLALLSHGVNLLLFGSGLLTRGRPAIFTDKENYLGVVNGMADPLPQALVLTAIVISFGITAFIVVLVNRRDQMTGSDVLPGEVVQVLNTGDPFGQSGGGPATSADEDYDLLQYELDEVYDQPDVALPFHEEEEEMWE